MLNHSFNLEHLVFLLIGVVVGVVSCAFFLYQDNNEVFELLKKDSEDIHTELEKLKVELSDNGHIKEESLQYGDFLFREYMDHSGDQLWEAYQESKSK